MSKRKGVFAEGGRPTKLIRVDQNVRGPRTEMENIRKADMRNLALQKRSMNSMINSSRSMLNQRIEGFIGMEKKFLDTSYNASIAITADCTSAEADPATLNCLNGVGQGDTESSRDGKEYIIQGMTFEGTVRAGPYADQTAGVSSPVITVAIVLDTQTNGAQLNSEDVYTNPLAGATGNANLLRNLQYSKRFKVLKKWIIDCHVDGSSWDGTNIEVCSDIHKLSFFADKLNIKVQCNGTGNTVSAITNNSLHVVAFSTASTCNLTYNARIRFVG